MKLEVVSSGSPRPPKGKRPAAPALTLPDAPPPIIQSKEKTWKEAILGALGLSGVDTRSAIGSAIVHLAVLIPLAIFTLQTTGDRKVDKRELMEVDTELPVRKDLFESNTWQVADEPMLRKPGGGALRNATDPKAGDAGAENDAGEVLAGLSNTAVDAGNIVSKGGEADASGLGITDGIGGGGGEGIGSADFFGQSAKGQRFVYVIDHSYSMIANDAMDMAKEELVKSIDKLSPLMEFHVVFYNHESFAIDLPGKGLVKATEAHRNRAKDMIYRTPPEGGTDHYQGLSKAIAFRPDVIFVLTDAEDAEKKDMNKLLGLISARGKASTPTVHIIHFNHSKNKQPDKTIRMLSERTRGTYRVIDTNELMNNPKR